MFKSAREVAKMGVLSEFLVRKLIAQGKCPGFYSGKKFLVNVERLQDYLEAVSTPGNQ